MAQAQYTFDWDFSKLETVNIGSYTGVISRIYWTLWGADEQGNRVPQYGETLVDTAEFDRGTVDNFVDFAQVTKEHVEELIENALGENLIAQMTDNLTIQLQQLESAPAVRIPPWLS
jgi:hypothetical protein